MTDFPSDIDIKAVNKSTPAEGAPRTRPRGTGKLLSTTHGVGLALLRLEHVSAVEEGRADLEFELPSQDGNSNSKYTVRPWTPDWWPSFSVNEQ